MRTALVIQDSLRFLGGGELVCICTCHALQDLGYRVRLVSDTFPIEEVENVFGLGKVLANCEQVRLYGLGRRIARFTSLPGLVLGRRSKIFLEHQNADVTFVSRDPRGPDVLPDMPLFRFVYEMRQLNPFWTNYRYTRSAYKAMYETRSAQTRFLALSPRLVSELSKMGHATKLVYPSVGLGYKVQAKKNQVIYVTFLAPQKQVEDFVEVARKMPETKFYLVGRDTDRVNRIYNGYATSILAGIPKNVHYIEARIRQRPDLLEQSRVYLHTSREPGMGIAVIEALTAGCLPVAPRVGGAGEALDAAGIGLHYNSIDEAVHLVRLAMGQDTGVFRPPTPEEIATKSSIFSQESFRLRINETIKESSH